MQGQRSFVSILPENISFDHGSTSRDVSLDSQVPWNNMQNTTETRLPEYIIPSSDTNSQYLHHIGHSEWSLGETSSGAARNQADHNERKREHTFSIHSREAINLEECPLESSNILSLDNVDVNGHGYQTSNRLSPMHISGPDSVSQDINICSEFGNQEDDECQVIEHPDSHISLGSSNEKRPAIGGSSDSFGMSSECGGHMMEDSNYRPECSLDGQRLSCKRKALEIQIGNPSGAGSLDCFEHAGRNQWHAVTSAQISAANVSMPTPVPAANNLVFRNGTEQENSRIRLGVRGAASSNPLSLNARGAAESSHRNCRLRISGSHQLDRVPGNPFSTEVNVGNSDISSSRHASILARQNSLFDLNPTPPLENGSHHGQPPVLSHVPSVRRAPHSRSGASSSRTNTSSSAAIALDRERERDPLLYEESASGNIPRSILEHPMFVPASERGDSSQQPKNWNLAGWNNSIGGDVASTSQAGSTSWGNSTSASPFWSRRSHPLYPRRLSEMVRRTLLSTPGMDSCGQSSSSAIRSSSPGRSQETTLLSGSSNQAPHSLNTRSALLDRHLDGALGIPYSLRSLAAASEGRSSIMSEQIRHVLDLMRRGEGLRFEDMMMLDHSVFIGMTDMHDRHRDMRLDIDNMSYEELLALEDRIGNVCTGLNEETVMNRLKQRKYAERGDEDETEPCSICREEYKDGEDVGSLECGHDFHGDCIKQWLLHKNLCPVCKTTGLSV